MAIYSLLSQSAHHVYNEAAMSADVPGSKPPLIIVHHNPSISCLQFFHLPGDNLSRRLLTRAGLRLFGKQRILIGVSLFTGLHAWECASTFELVPSANNWSFPSSHPTEDDDDVTAELVCLRTSPRRNV